MTDLPRITLLSSSARRREIVSRSWRNAAIDDSRGAEPRPAPREIAEDYVVRSAAAKLGQPPWEQSEGFLMSADTVVVLGEEILGKPNSASEARKMLEALSDTWHRVVTGVAILDSSTGACRTGRESTDIRTRQFSEQDIAAYIASGEPYDKAGAYAVQDDQFRPVTHVRGCYLNVVGLPVCLVSEILLNLGAGAGVRQPELVPYYANCEDCRLGDIVGGQS